MDYEGCTILTQNPKIVVKENRSSFEVLNPERKDVYKLEVDNVLITDHRERCDWIISTNTPRNRALYIELKGCDVQKAASQLEATLGHTKAHFKGYKKECFIVSTRVPKHGPSMQKLKKVFNSRTGVILSVTNIKSSVTI